MPTNKEYRDKMRKSEAETKKWVEEQRKKAKKKGTVPYFDKQSYTPKPVKKDTTKTPLDTVTTRQQAQQTTQEQAEKRWDDIESDLMK